MTAASVAGVPITPERAAACWEFLSGVASAEAWEQLIPLVEVSERVLWGISPEADGEHKRHPPFGEIEYVEPPPLRLLAISAVGSACARCGWPIASTRPEHGEPLEDGWCCAWCVTKERALQAYRRRAAAWLKRGVQLGLFGEAAPARRRKARR